jgi:dihydroorotate dehydrogenase (fumarate)
MAVDLKTRYLGLELDNPVVASASPMTGKVENLVKLQEAGVGAVVLPSLFEEQIEHEEQQVHQLQEFGAESFGEALDYFPPLDHYNTGTDSYLELIRGAKAKLDVPVIASLNGTTTGGWLRYAKMLEEAGADALELNIYLLATDPRTSGAEVEQQYLDLVAAVRKDIKIPLAIKVGPYFSSIAHMMLRLQEAGADGLVLFNRFLQPDVDLESLTVVPHLELSTSFESRLPLRWIAILRDEIGISLASTTGAQNAQDVIKLVLSGADAVMMTSALLRLGPDHVRTVLFETRNWLEENEYESVEQMKGSMSLKKAADPSAYERANYVKTLISYTGPFI